MVDNSIVACLGTLWTDRNLVRTGQKVTNNNNITEKNDKTIEIRNNIISNHSKTKVKRLLVLNDLG